MSLDFFKGVNNLNQGRTYERNYSGRDFIQGPSSPLSSPVKQSIQDRRDTHVHRQQDHVSGHSSWTNHNPIISIPEGLPRDHHHQAYPYNNHQDYGQRSVIPNEHTRSLGHPTINYNIPNGPFIQAPPPFSYNEAPPRTSAHFHGCPSCASPLMVQVTADLSYHHVTLIPAATARRNQMPLKNGAQEYSPPPESIPRTHPETDDDDGDGDDDDSLSNEMLTVPEKQPEMVTDHNEVVETKEMRRSYASITAGKIMGDYKPYSEEENKPPSLLEEETNTNTNTNNEDKPNSEEDREGKDNMTTNPPQVEDAFDVNGFTTVVSSKTKKKVKAEAKAAAFAEVKRMFNKHRRGGHRDERGARGDRDKRGMGGPRDHHGYDNKHGRVAKDHGQDIHRGPPKDGHDKATRAAA